MNLFNIGVDGQYRLAALLAAAVGGARRRCRRPLHVAVDHRRRDAGRRALGRHRRRAQGRPRGQRGHLDDHAELHRRPALIAFLLTRAARGARRGQQQHRHQADPAVRPGAGHRPDRRRRRARSTGSSSLAVVVGVGTGSCSTAPASASTCGPPAAREPAAVASGVNVKRMVARSRCCISGAVAGLVGMPQLLGASLLATASTSRPGSASPASRSRCSAATTRSASRSARCSGRSSTVARRSSTCDDIPKEIVTIMQGVDRAVGRHRLRAGPPLPRSPQQQRDVGRAAGARRRPPRRRRRRHERRRRRPTPTRRAGAARGARRRRTLEPRRSRSIARRAGRCCSRSSASITGADDLTSGGTDRRGARGWPCRSAWPASAACGPSAPAWSTSASRA